MAVEWQSSGSRVAIAKPALEDNIQHYEPAHLNNNPPEAKATALVDRRMRVRHWTGLSNRTGLHWKASPPRRDSKVTHFSYRAPGI